MTAKRGKMSGAELRAFRSQVAKLKSKGLVSKRTDARKQKPTKYMKAKVARLSEVISGAQTSVKLDRATALRYKEAGFFTFGNRVVVSKGQAEVARRDKGSGLIVVGELRGRVPYEKVVMPYGVNTLRKFLAAIESSPPDPQIFAAKKRPQDYWAFQYHGNNSLSAFASLHFLKEHIERGEQYYDFLKTNDDDKRAFQAFVLYRTNEAYWLNKIMADRTAKKNARARDRKDTRRVEERKALALRGKEIMQARQETYAEMNARHQREHRERIRERMKNDADFARAQRDKEAKKKAAQRAKKRAR